MNALRLLRRMSFLSDRRRLELYPPFFLTGVKVVELSQDWRRVRLLLPLRFISRNAGGAMFGGYQAALADPIAALACVRSFPGFAIWTRRLQLDFRRQWATDLELRFAFDPQAEHSVREDLERRGRSTQTFGMAFHLSDGTPCTQIENTVALRT